MFRLFQLLEEKTLEVRRSEEKGSTQSEELQHIIQVCLLPHEYHMMWNRMYH